MITMYEPDGEPAGAGGGLPDADEGRATAGAGGLPDEDVAGASASIAVHDVELVPGTSRAEFIGTMLDRVPAQARFVEADGDVDVTLRWRTDEPSALDLLIGSEGMAWRTWRDAERRARDFARLHRRATDVARAAHSTWYRAASDLVEQHPEFRRPDTPSGRREQSEAGADRDQERHAAPGDPPTWRLPSRTEIAAQAMLGRLDLGDAPFGAADAALEAAAAEERRRRLTGHAPGTAGAGTDDPDRGAYEAALEAWHAAADGDGFDVPLRADDDVVELTEPSTGPGDDGGGGGRGGGLGADGGPGTDDHGGGAGTRRDGGRKSG